MKVEGRCHCGAIVFQAEVDPDLAAICHCTDCQRFSGAPFRTGVPAKAENFHLTRGRPKIYVKTADSGAKRAQSFCENCGTAIYASAVDNPTVYVLRLSALDQRTEIAPRRQIWCSSALPWAYDIKELPASPKQ